MTRIQKLSATGLKGGDFTHELAAVNVVVGANFSGKTSVLDAIRLALMGYLPELGKTNAATFQLSNGKEMSVKITCEDGTGMVRDWKQERTAVKAWSEGNLPPTPDVLIDPQTYFALSDKERVRYVFGLTEIAGNESTAKVVGKNIRGIRCEPHTEHHDKAIDSLRELAGKTTGRSVQDWVEWLIAACKERLKVVRETADRLAKTVAGITSITAEDDEVVASVAAELKTARAVVVDTVSKRGGLMRAHEDAVQQSSRLNKARADLQMLKDQSSKIVELTNRIAGLEKVTAGYVSKLSGARQNLASVERDIAVANQLLASLDKQKANLWAEYDAVLTHDECPCCGSKADWKQSFGEKTVKQSQEFVGQSIDCGHHLTALEKWQADATTEVVRCECDDKENQFETGQLQVASAELKTATANQQKLELAKQAVSSLGNPEADLAKLKTVLDTSRQACSDAEAKVEILQQRHDNYIRSREQSRLNARAILERQQAVAEVEVTKLVVTMLEELQAEMVRTAFGSILEVANKVCDGILKSPLAYHEGEIGRWEGATWISHKTFSGTEKLVSYSGIAAALAKDAPVRIVLIDELGRLDAENKEKLIRRLRDLTIDGVIDQAVLVDTVEPTIGLVNVIRL